MFFKLMIIGILFHSELSTVNAWNIPIPGSNHDSIQAISEMAVKIISECYSENKEIVIHGNSDQFVIKSLREIESLPVFIFNDASLVDDPIVLRMHHNTFVMTPNSITQLERMIKTFKVSQRWNVKAPFFILDMSDKGCKNAKGMLRTAWKFSIVKSFFLCVDSDRVPMIYTYNPYTNRAPRPWKQVPSPAKQSKGWTMYSRQHGPGKICKDVDFDRTEHLDGSTIRVAVEPQKYGNLVPYQNYNESIEAELWPEFIYTVERLKYSLNVTTIFNIFEEPIAPDYAKNGSYDVILLYFVPQENISYPVLYESFYIVTNNRGFYTPVEKIRNFYGMVTAISMCVILTMTFIVIILSEERRRWSFAVFEILRLLINTALHSRMDTIALRIFFSMVFLYFLIIQATFQGHLSAFLTKQEYRKNAETMNDLKDTMYDTINIHQTAASFITDPVLQKKLIPGGRYCVEDIVDNDSAVCICTRNEFINLAFKHQMHVSKNLVYKRPNYYKIRADWPLEERFNLFLMWLESSGQSAPDWKRRNYERIMETQKRIAAKKALPERRPISLKMLEFIFIFLAIGLKVALMSFTVERRVRPETTRRRQNELAAQLNIENRRRQIINRIISDNTLVADSRPRSV